MSSDDVPESKRTGGDSGAGGEASPNPDHVAEVPGQTGGADTVAPGATAPGPGTGGGAEPPGQQAPPEFSTSGFVLGALGLVSAGLGLVSLTGMTLTGMLRDRAQINAQIQSSLGGSGGNPVQAAYNTPWQDTAIVNGAVGIVAAVLGAVVLIIAAPRIETRRWQQPVALAGVILGVIGIIIAVGMYTGAFAPAPHIPSAPAPAPGGAPGGGAPGGG
jgi:hypothetical protein